MGSDAWLRVDSRLTPAQHKIMAVNHLRALRKSVQPHYNGYEICKGESLRDSKVVTRVEKVASL